MTLSNLLKDATRERIEKGTKPTFSAYIGIAIVQANYVPNVGNTFIYPTITGTSELTVTNDNIIKALKYACFAGKGIFLGQSDVLGTKGATTEMTEAVRYAYYNDVLPTGETMSTYEFTVKDFYSNVEFYNSLRENTQRFDVFLFTNNSVEIIRQKDSYLHFHAIGHEKQGDNTITITGKLSISARAKGEVVPIFSSAYRTQMQAPTYEITSELTQEETIVYNSIVSPYQFEHITLENQTLQKCANGYIAKGLPTGYISGSTRDSSFELIQMPIEYKTSDSSGVIVGEQDMRLFVDEKEIEFSIPTAVTALNNELWNVYNDSALFKRLENGYTSTLVYDSARYIYKTLTSKEDFTWIDTGVNGLFSLDTIEDIATTTKYKVGVVIDNSKVQGIKGFEFTADLTAYKEHSSLNDNANITRGLYLAKQNDEYKVDIGFEKLKDAFYIAGSTLKVSTLGYYQILGDVTIDTSTFFMQFRVQRTEIVDRYIPIVLEVFDTANTVTHRSILIVEFK